MPLLRIAALLFAAHSVAAWQQALATTLTFSQQTAVTLSQQRSCAASAKTAPPRIESPRMVLTEDRVSAAMEIKPVKQDSARASGLALALDDGTRKSHSMAENTAFVTGFFKGISTRAAFSQLVASLYFVYAAMEKAFDASEDESVKALDYPELRRLRTLEADMEYYFGASWREEVQPTAATAKYCERIAAVARDDPPLLIAHMYTRYLGDLFGGQMMGGMARSSLKLEPGAGTSFYEFDEIPSAKPFIEQWYARLNSLPLSAESQAAIVDEANRVFALNIEIFDELEGGKRAMLRAVWSVVRSAFRSRLRGGK